MTAAELIAIDENDDAYLATGGDRVFGWGPVYRVLVDLRCFAGGEAVVQFLVSRYL